MPEAVQLIIFTALTSAIGLVWRTLNGKIEELAKEIKALQDANEKLREENGDLHDEIKWLQAERNQLRRLYIWFRDAYRALGGKDNPPPAEDDEAIPGPGPRATT